MNSIKPKITLLIVDDDEFFCEAIRDDVSKDFFQIFTVHRVEDAKRLCLSTKFDVVLLDNHLPDGNGLNLTQDILRFNENSKIILITGFPTLENAVEALKIGIFDYILKPINLDELRVTITKALRALALEKVEQVEDYKNSKESEENILIGTGEAFHNIQETIAKAARSDAPILITGETGTGKNVVAKAIHYFTPTGGKKPFISVNCSALPENLIEAELFGVEKGAFTGAIASKKGTFELADGGTLFLDEIGEMPFNLQSKLLSALEERKIKRLGGEFVRSINIRIIAATNVDPEVAINQNRLRRDLYYRLGVIRIHLPTLRERIQDISTLCRFFILKLARGRELHLPNTEIQKLMEYDWPGNIRELRNIIERCLILQEGPVLYPSELLVYKKNYKNNFDKSQSTEKILTLVEVERSCILTALDKFSGNKTKTAEALGISLSNLKRKLKEYMADGSKRTSSQ